MHVDAANLRSQINDQRRREYLRRLDCEAQGVPYAPPSPPAPTSPRGAQGRPKANGVVEGGVRLAVAATREERAWLRPPQIPPPMGWTGYWDLCAGHEVIVELAALRGVTADNSPTLFDRVMTAELLSCIQRMKVGCYMVLYTMFDTPHERFFYVKSLPSVEVAGQYGPYFCYSTHRHSLNAMDAIPLSSVMYVTGGMHTHALKKQMEGPHSVRGPFVGKERVSILSYGAFSIWIFDGKRVRPIDLVCTDPLAYVMWRTLLNDVAEFNATCDTTGSVRALQNDLERLRVEGKLGQRDLVLEERRRESGGFFRK